MVHFLSAWLKIERGPVFTARTARLLPVAGGFKVF
jgi:hypothetical protein